MMSPYSLLEALYDMGIEVEEYYGDYESKNDGRNDRQGYREKKWLEMVNRKREQKIVTRCSCLDEMWIKRKDGSGKWYVSRVGFENNLCDLFWSNGRSQFNYAIFEDVLAFDATYGRNKYNFSFVVFLGVNHHNKPVSLDVQWSRAKHKSPTSGFCNSFWYAWKERPLRQSSQMKIPRCEMLYVIHCMLADMEVEEFKAQWEAILDECGVREVEWGRFVESRFGVLEFVTNFQRCIDFLEDNEDRLEFCSWYGTPVLQTEFVGLEKDGWAKYMQEMFWRFHETLKRPEKKWEILRQTIGRVACMKDEDFKYYSHKVLTDTVCLEIKSDLRHAKHIGVMVEEQGVKDPICVTTKGGRPTGCKREEKSSTHTGAARRCSFQQLGGCFSWRPLRCFGVAHVDFNGTSTWEYCRFLRLNLP
ncbi:hypothetical protein AHAS_Ahas20G0154900 [Arachis hypogaea]